MERNINVWLPLACPPLGTCPVTQACALDRESNQVLFGLQASTQSTESQPVSYTHLTLPTSLAECRSRWSPYH